MVDDAFSLRDCIDMINFASGNYRCDLPSKTDSEVRNRTMTQMGFG